MSYLELMGKLQDIQYLKSFANNIEYALVLQLSFL